MVYVVSCSVASKKNKKKTYKTQQLVERERRMPETSNTSCVTFCSVQPTRSHMVVSCPGVAASQDQDFGTANLHAEVSDVVSVLVYVGVAKGNGVLSKTGEHWKNLHVVLTCDQEAVMNETFHFILWFCFETEIFKYLIVQ